MPLYDYNCETCGPFRQFRSINERSEPVECTQCGAPGQRVLTAPQLSLMSSNNRIAEMRNEKSAHEPNVVTVLDRGADKRSAPKAPKPLHKHGAGHGHSHGPKSHRPWMIGH